MSFAQKVAFSRSELLYLVKGKDAGRSFWHYILVDKSRLPLFKIKVQSPFISLTDYGEVLYSGWGDEPPEDIQAKINEQFQ